MDEFKITFLGCGDAFSSGGRANTAFYLEAGDVNILIDCGSTTLYRMKVHQLDLNKLGYIFISHLHGDHFGGLPYLLLELKRKERKQPLYVIGPPEIEKRTWELTEMLYPGSEENFDKKRIVFHEYAEANFDQISLKVFPVKHTPSTHPHALKMQIGTKVIAYSGDTAWSNNLLKVAKGADLFICECCFFDREVAGHLNYKTLEQHRKKLRCKNMILTHMDEEMLSVGKNLVDEQLAYDGLTVAI